MKILLIGPATPSALADLLDDARTSLPQGLGGTPVNGLARALVELGHEVALVTCSRDVDQAVTLRGPRLTIVVTHYRSRPRDRALDLFRLERHLLRSAMRAFDPDVVHAHWTYEFAWAALASTAPVVITAHDSPIDILGYHRDAYRFLRLLMALRVRLSARNLTAVAPYLASRWRTTLRYKRKIAVIPNIAPFALTKEPGSVSTLRVLDVADGSDRKNIRTLLKAFATVRIAESDAILTLIGNDLQSDGPVAQWARDRNLADGVEFLGTQNRERVASQLRQATLFVHPSLEEAQPMCLLEAIAFRLPIIAGVDAGGVPWTLDGGKAGLLTDVRNPEALAEAILATHRGTADAQERVAYAAAMLEERFSPAAVGEAYLSSYRDAMQARH